MPGLGQRSATRKSGGLDRGQADGWRIKGCLPCHPIVCWKALDHPSAGTLLAGRDRQAVRLATVTGGRAPPVGYGNAFMQLVGTRAGDHRAGRVGGPGLAGGR
jgi:hypothetical protein